MNILSFSRFFANIFLLIGIVCLVLGILLLFRHYSPNRLAFASEKIAANFENNTQNLPQFLTISSAGISLPIFPAKVENDNWEVSNQGVSYMVNSALPGEKGNSIFYGHNWTSLLGNLIKAKPGDLISIKFSNGMTKEFIIKYIFEVPPTESSILGNTDYPQLTIYTCSGFLDSKRFVVIANPI